MTQANRSASSARRSANVTLPAELLERAKALKINVSRASERGLREEIRDVEARTWSQQNARFIAELNSRIERDGLPLDEYRMF